MLHICCTTSSRLRSMCQSSALFESMCRGNSRLAPTTTPRFQGFASTKTAATVIYSLMLLIWLANSPICSKRLCKISVCIYDYIYVYTIVFKYPEQGLPIEESHVFGSFLWADPASASFIWKMISMFWILKLRPDSAANPGVYWRSSPQACVRHAPIWRVRIKRIFETTNQQLLASGSKHDKRIFKIYVLSPLATFTSFKKLNGGCMKESQHIVLIWFGASFFAWPVDPFIYIPLYTKYSIYTSL